MKGETLGDKCFFVASNQSGGDEPEALFIVGKWLFISGYYDLLSAIFL